MTEESIFPVDKEKRSQPVNKLAADLTGGWEWENSLMNFRWKTEKVLFLVHISAY